MKTHHLYILLLAIFLSGCYGRGMLVIPAESHRHSTHTTTIVTHHNDNRPPAHAPAHGHRHRHHNHDLRFDSGFGAYVVINMPGLYFYDDHYIRFYDDRWQVTNRLNGTWRAARQNDIPRKLKKAKRHNKKHRRDHRAEHRNEHHDEPRHGHRRHHHNHDLSFDSRIGVYVIAKQPGIFFFNNRYIRHYRGKWQSTSKLNGRWHSAKDSEVPRKLKSTKHSRKEKRSRKEKHSKKEESKGRYKEKWQ